MMGGFVLFLIIATFSGLVTLGAGAGLYMLGFLGSAAAPLILINLVAVFAGVCTLAERKVAGHIQARVGPYRVGPHGLLQWVADAVKLLVKEDVIPNTADRLLFRLAPYIVMAGAFTAFLALPYAKDASPSHLNIGILYVLAVSSAIVIGILMAGWASGSKWALFGAMRSAAQIVSYEVPVGVTLLGMLMMAGTLDMHEIIKKQEHGFIFNMAQDTNLGMFSWYVFRHPPFTLLALIIYFAASLAETNRTPFDIPEAESELVAGYHTEYSGMRFSFFFLAEYASMFVVAAVAVTFFLGGWLPPFGHLFGPHAFLGEAWGLKGLTFLEGVFWFVSKCCLVVFVQMWVRWTLPRYRVDQLMDLCWKKLLPLALLNFVAIGTIERFPDIVKLFKG